MYEKVMEVGKTVLSIRFTFFSMKGIDKCHRPLEIT